MRVREGEKKIEERERGGESERGREREKERERDGEVGKRVRGKDIKRKEDWEREFESG